MLGSWSKFLEFLSKLNFALFCYGVSHAGQYIPSCPLDYFGPKVRECSMYCVIVNKTHFLSGLVCQSFV